jgi:CheY-like chemotaxis protein
VYFLPDALSSQIPLRYNTKNTKGLCLHWFGKQRALYSSSLRCNSVVFMMNQALNALNGSDGPIKILVADDSSSIRRVIRQLLALQNSIEVVGEADSYAQAIQMTSSLRPRLVVLDLHMPDEKHVTPEEVKTCLALGSELLAISVWNDESAEVLAQRLGATILLDKANLASTLIPTILRLCQQRRPV